MKTMTVTLATTPKVPQPLIPDQPLADFAGFRLTLTAPSGNAVSSEVLQQTVWTFGEMIEGATYTLLAEAVDINGAVIQALPLLKVTVPVADGATYTRLDGASIDWA